MKKRTKTTMFFIGTLTIMLLLSSMYSVTGFASYRIYENNTAYAMGPTKYNRVLTTGVMNYESAGPVSVVIDIEDVDTSTSLALYKDASFVSYITTPNDARQTVTISMGISYGSHTFEIKYVGSNAGDWINIYEIDLQQSDSSLLYSDTSIYYLRNSIVSTGINYFSASGAVTVAIRFVDIDFTNNLWVKIDGVKTTIQPIIDGQAVLNGYWTISVYKLLNSGTHSIEVGINNGGDWINIYSITVVQYIIV